MKTFTLSIQPDLFEKQMEAEHARLGIDTTKWNKAMYSYAKLLLSKEKEQMDLMDVFREYISNYCSEMENYIAKNPDNTARIIEIRTRLDILISVCNRYEDFQSMSRNLMHENIGLKSREFKLRSTINAQAKEIENLKESLTEKEL